MHKSESRLPFLNLNFLRKEFKKQQNCDKHSIRGKDKCNIYDNNKSPSLYTQFEKVSYCNVLSLAKHSQYVVVVRLKNERTAQKKVP